MKANDDYNKYKAWYAEKGLPIRRYNNFCHLRQYFSESILSEPERTEAKDEGSSEAGDGGRLWKKHSWGIIDSSGEPRLIVEEVEFNSAMSEYAAMRTAALEAKVKRKDDFIKKQDEGIKSLFFEKEQLRSALSEANKRIDELEKAAEYFKQL